MKLMASLALFLVLAIHSFHPWIGPRLQMALTVLKVSPLLSIFVFAIVQGCRGYMPEELRDAFSSLGHLMRGSTRDLGGYALALYIGLWAYDGWDQAIFVTGEMKNPSRSISLALPLSTMTVTILFFTTVLSYFVLLPPAIVIRTNSVTLNFGLMAIGAVGAIVFASFVAFSCIGALNAHLYTYSRLTAAAAREGFLPQVFGRLHLGSTRCVFVHRIRLPPLLPHPASSSKLPQTLYTSIMYPFRIITDRRNPCRNG